MITRPMLIFAIAIGLVVGFAFSIQALHVFAVRNQPVVTGHIVARTPIREFSVSRVDFTIQIEGTPTKVHARAQGHLMNKVPDVVRFRSSGDPAQEVFLFEYEENPYWVALFSWGGALLLAIPLASPRVRKLLGWAW